MARGRQHGALSREQALRAGMSAAQVDRRLRRRQWLPLAARGWYVLAAHAENPLAALTAATRSLAGPAWADSALPLFGMGDHPHIPMVASDRDHSGPGIQRVHVTRLDDLPRTTVDGIDTVTAAVAVVSSGRWLRSETDLQVLIDRAIRSGTTTWREVEQVLTIFPCRGRAGSTKMRIVLADRRSDPALPLSDWGRRFVAGLADSALPRPRLEYRVVDKTGRLIAQVDAAYPEHRYAIELDSHAYHINPEAFELDRRRDGDLAQVGWLVRRFTWQQWNKLRPWVVATIRADLEARPGHGQTP
ncbi:MAG: hypothetical protein OES24_01420 [Acidimicrobiia bacterium]|nr:hypothetical protein [Acidimicrobiia bacterium]